jgi:hypothetical protein
MADAAPASAFPLREALEGLLQAIARKRDTGAPSEHDLRATPLPYPGLQPFTADTSTVFVGREDQTRQVLERLSETQTVLILGGSGCGKSSLLRGGVLPRLSTTAPIRGRPGAWYGIAWRPERHPIKRLEEAFCRDFLVPALTRLRERRDELRKRADDPLEPAESVAELRQRIAKLEEATPKPLRGIFDANADAVAREDLALAFVRATLADSPGPAHPGFSALRRCVEALDRNVAEDPGAPGANVLLVIDQFEEVFRREVDADERRRLMRLIRYAYEFKTRGVFLALVMRSEDLHRCAEEPGLPEIVNSSSMFVDWLDRPQLRQVIVEPAQSVFRSWLGLRPSPDDPAAPFETEVVDALLDDEDVLKGRLEHKGDHLPLLQHGLRMLWLRAADAWRNAAAKAKAAGRDLTAEDLRIGKRLLEDTVNDARASVRKHNPADTGDRTRLQWLLASSAETALVDAKRTFLHEAGRSRSKVTPELALKAAFCEMASLDENRRYYRAFRTAEEIARKRFPPRACGSLERPLKRALDVFDERGLLSNAGSDARDVTHEALIRNWPRLSTWVAEDVTIRRAMEEAIRNRRVRGWEQAKALEPVLAYPPSPIYPLAWAQDVAKSAGEAARRRFDKRVPWRLRRSYWSIRLRTPLIGGGVTLILALMAFGWFSVHLAALRAEIMRAQAIAANLSSRQQSSQSVQQRATELLAAAAVLERAKKDRLEKSLPGNAAWFVRGELQLAEQAIDAAARELLGRSLAVYVVSGNDEPGPRPDCATVLSPARLDVVASPKEENGDATRAKSAMSPARRNVKVAVESGAIRLLNGNGVPARLAAPGLPKNLPLGTQICISSDSELMTLGQPGQPWPTVYLLGWHADGDSAPDGWAAPLPVVTSYVPGVPISSADGTRLRPTVTHISDRNRDTGQRTIRFNLGFTQPGGQPRELRFSASFFEGYAAPVRLNTHLTGEHEQPCSEEAAAAGLIKLRRCNVMLSGLSLESDEYPEQSDDGVLALLKSELHVYFRGPYRTGPGEPNSFPTTAVNFYAPPIRSVQLKGADSVRLRDQTGEVWELRLVRDLKSIHAPLKEMASTRDQREPWSNVCRATDCQEVFVWLNAWAKK